MTSIRKGRSAFGLRGGLSITRGFIRRNLWTAPVLAMVALAFAGIWLRGQLEDAVVKQKESELKVLLKADVAALTLWMRLQQDNAIVMAQEPAIRQPAVELARFAAEGNRSLAALLQAPQREPLDQALAHWLTDPANLGYVVFDRERLILAAKPETLIGMPTALDEGNFIESVFSGNARVSRPTPSRTPQPDAAGRMAVGVPVMFVAAPVYDDERKVVAAIALRIKPYADFTKILNVAQPGDSGETYAFDERGKMLSDSRFNDQLVAAKLLVDQPNPHSALALDIRDPGVDMIAGGKPALARSDQPLTHMAAHAIQNKPAVDNPGFYNGYRDYRGIDTIGVWCWLPEYDFGVATEMDKAEAMGPLAIVRTVFWTLFGLLTVAALGLLGFALLARRLENRMREAVIAAGQLGQYALEEKIGEGGMGSVFRGRHAMLRRPTAIKLLEPAKTTEVSIARFEREVQLTSQLNHPNTITVYDYGRTDEGVFYYAMEFLDGLSLESLVERYGPQPDGRVTRIMMQVCGSLIEAHAAGLIHRDIKPANIMLTARGGVYDFVKLLDFGLVKAIDAQKQRVLTAADAITGTPLYLPPESIQDTDRADARSDLYSLGGVAYFLLTGRPVFDVGGVMDILRQHVEAPPIPPSKRLGRPVEPRLEQLVLKCLAKSPGDRPQSAAELADALAECVPLQAWTTADAQHWWNEYDAGRKSADQTATATQSIKLGGTLGYSEMNRTT